MTYTTPTWVTWELLHELPESYLQATYGTVLVPTMTIAGGNVEACFQSFWSSYEDHFMFSLQCTYKQFTDTMLSRLLQSMLCVL